MPLVSTRPRNPRPRRQKGALERISRATAAMSITPDPAPTAQIADDVARRGQIVGRTLLLVIFQFVLMSLGFATVSIGIILRDSATPWDTFSLETTAREISLLAIYLLFIAFAGGAQKSIRNQHPRFFAEHHLLCSLELISTLRRGRPGGGDLLDVDRIRQNLVGEFGVVATYLRRQFGRRRSSLEREARDNARQRAAELARTMAAYQGVVLYGSLEEIFALAPEIWKTLVALAEQRLSDLPRVHGASFSDGIGTLSEDKSNFAARSDGSPLRPISDGFQPEDVDTLRRELSRIYTTTASAKPILRSIEYPPERRPNIDYLRPEAAWHQIFEDLQNGAVAGDPYILLLAYALESNPANPTFRSLALQYGLPALRTRAPRRTVPLVRRFRWPIF